MNLMKLTAASLMAAALLAGCGGGGKDSGTSAFGGGSGSTSTGAGTTGSGTSSSTAGTIVLSLSSTVVSSSSPGVVTALVKNASGTVIPNALVTFSSSSASATVSPATATTGSDGQAATTLTPVSNAGNGAAYVNASVDLPDGTTLTTRVAFSFNATGVTLVSVTPARSSLNAYASTAIAVAVSAASSASPVTVNFTSTCASSGKATISPASLVLTSTTGSVTYQDNGCGATDAVNVQISGTTQQLTRNLAVAVPAASSLQFVSSTPDTICIFGSGCSATATVKFRLIDQSGTNGRPGEVIDFVLDQPQAADLGAPSATTDSDGYVTVSVSSKAVPSPVRVTASLDTNNAISTVSNALTIKSGRPYQSGISLAATVYSLSYDVDGDNTNLRLQLVDRFGNPVPDGTVVNLVASGGSVVPASCTTASSVCNVQYVVSNPRPANGRVAVVAYAQGEETFIDANSNNVYDSGESFTDLGPVTIDRNGNGVVDAGETLVGAPADGVWSNNGYVRINTQVFMSKTAVAPRLFSVDSSGNCTDSQITGWSASSPAFTVTTGSGAACRSTVAFCLRDGNTAADTLHGNPVVSGATLAITTNADGAAVSIDNSPVPASLSGPTRHIVTAGRSACGTALTSSGTADVTVNLRNNVYTFRDLIKIQ